MYVASSRPRHLLIWAVKKLKPVQSKNCTCCLRCIRTRPEKLGSELTASGSREMHWGRGRGSGSSAWMAVKIPFPTTRCITGVVQSSHGKVCEALRFAVHPQLVAFRDALGLPVMCAASGVIIPQRKDLHIDHREPFWMLLERFCQDRNVDLTKLETFGSAEKLALVDQNISSAFAQHHRLRASVSASKWPLLESACRPLIMMREVRILIFTVSTQYQQLAPRGLWS